jgi:hypothetical protein
MAMGEDDARALGVETGRLRLLVIGCATLVTAAAVAISGIIGRGSWQHSQPHPELAAQARIEANPACGLPADIAVPLQFFYAFIMMTPLTGRRSSPADTPCRRVLH